MTEKDYIRYNVLSDTLFWTKYIFVRKHNRKFNVAYQHEVICSVLDRVYSGELRRVLIRVPPRYGKTELAVKQFMAKGLALNPSSKFLHLSYSSELAVDNSAEVKDIVSHPAYQELFPFVKIKTDSKAKHKWTTTKGGGVYATSTGGQVTGFGAGHVIDFDKIKEYQNITPIDTYYDSDGKVKQDVLKFLNSLNKDYTINPELFGGAIIVDDPLKPEDALSDTVRKKMNQRFYNTIKSRTNSRYTPMIVIGQALHEEDLIGYLMKKEPGVWTLINLPAIMEDENGEEVALYPQMHTLKELKQMQEADDFNFETQYMQNPKPIEGLLFPESETKYYFGLPEPEYIHVQVDPADDGSDNLCSAVYYVCDENVYVANVIYTQDSSELTIPRIINQIKEYAPASVNIESNAGWALFRKEIKKQINDLDIPTDVKSFNSKSNKEIRIFNQAPYIRRNFYYSKNGNKEYQKYLENKHGYLKMVKNQKDDGVDCDAAACAYLKKIGVIPVI